MALPVITIITPTKNRLLLLRESIASVQAQTLTEWEHLIIDDGSDDGSLEMIEQMAAQDARLRLLKRPGDLGGANVCRNLGIAESRGEFLIFLDSDDLLSPVCLMRRVEAMTKNRDLDFAVFLAGHFVHTPGDRRQQLSSEIIGDDLLRFLTFDCPWQTSAPIWRKTAVCQLGGWDESLPSWQDVDLHIRAICRGLSYLKIPELDYHVRWQYEETKVSVMQRQSSRHLQEAIVTLAKFEEEVRRGPGMNWTRQRAIAGLYFLLAELWIAAGDRSSALHAWTQGRQRNLSNAKLHVIGSCLVWLSSFRPLKMLTARLIHKWKGFVRFRINPELIDQ